MLNDEDSKDGELQLEVTADTESLESSQGSQEAEGEIGDSPLNLEIDEPKVDKLSIVEQNAIKQSEHWLAEVLAGNKKLEDAPTWVQKRITPQLEGTSGIEEGIRKVLEKEREDATFKELQAQIPALSPDQAKELQERFNTLRPAGKVAALKASLDAMGLNSKVKEAEQRGIAKGRVSLPRSGQPSVRKSEQLIDGIPQSTFQDNKAWNALMKSRRQA